MPSPMHRKHVGEPCQPSKSHQYQLAYPSPMSGKNRRRLWRCATTAAGLFLVGLLATGERSFAAGQANVDAALSRYRSGEFDAAVTQVIGGRTIRQISGGF